MNNNASAGLSKTVSHVLAKEYVAQERISHHGFQKSMGTYLKLLQRFGGLQGTKLFFQIMTRQFNSLKLPGIKHPVSLRKATSDVYVFYQVFLYNEYDIKFKTTPRVIIDGGANIGLFTVKMKAEFPDAKIICVEPDKSNFQQLQKNVSPYEDVFCENRGVWSREAKLKVWDKYEIGEWAYVVEEDEKDWNVNAISIKALMKKYNIDFIDVLKLDIESSEKQVFSEDFSYWVARTKMIIIELHDSMKEGCAQQFFEAIHKTISNYTFSIKGENVVIINKDI